MRPAENGNNDSGTLKYKWTAHRDDDGQEYFYNEETGESAWDPPEEGYNESEYTTGVASSATAKDTLPSPQGSPWTKHTNEEGLFYYYNHQTDETTWDKPDDYVEFDDDDDDGDDDDIDNSNINSVDDKGKGNDAIHHDMSTSSNQYEKIDKTGSTSPSETIEPMEVDIPKDDVTDDKSVNGDALTGVWQRHQDDDGQYYYYNEITGETTWDKPLGFVPSGDDSKATDDEDDDDVDDENGKHMDDGKDTKLESSLKGGEDAGAESNEANTELTPYQPSSPPQDATPVSSTATSNKNVEDRKLENLRDENLVETNGKWSKHVDEEGREYYYNELTKETQWDKPDGFVDITDSKWSKHLDDEGREFYYNETTGETTWDMPTAFQQGPIENDDVEPVSTLSAATHDKSPSAIPHLLKIEAADNTIETPEPESESEPLVDPAGKRLQAAEIALNQPDAIMEPNCLDNVRELISGNVNEGGSKAMQSLLSSFKGETAICGLLGLWLANLKKAEDNHKAVDDVRETAQQVIDKVAKDRFTKAGGDNIFQLKKSEAVFLEDMMDSPLWRKLLIDLSATHRDSTLLSYCLSSISKRGHHREIAKRINQSDHFPVYSAMLMSEFAIIGNGGDSVGVHELVGDLRRSCTSTSYTYLYAVELLRHLVQTANERVDRNPSLYHAIRKWSRLREELDYAMIDTGESPKTGGASSLHRKRRRDVALIISELTQRQRRRLPPGVNANGNRGEDDRDALELALSNLLLRHAEGKKFDDPILDELLSHGRDPVVLGQMMNTHPLSIKTLLGHLFLPGSLRAGSLNTRSKCARLIALAVLAAEAASERERRFEDPAKRQVRDEEIRGSLLTGSQMCELVENMVSFAVSSDRRVKEANPSAGVKLSVLANQHAPVAQGVMMWAKELVSANEFVSSASYPTLAPSMLSLVRVISVRHPFTRPTALDVAVSFLGHSNSELTFQKMNEIKEQALRVMLMLLLHGEVASVLTTFVNLLEVSTINLDSSLVRYFTSGLLDMVIPPCSADMVGALGKLLMSPKCMEALQSAYFPNEKKLKLKTLISTLRLGASAREGKMLEVLDTLVRTYA